MEASGSARKKNIYVKPKECYSLTLTKGVEGSERKLVEGKPTLRSFAEGKKEERRVHGYGAV